jgi:hypothetical protein
LVNGQHRNTPKVKLEKPSALKRKPLLVYVAVQHRFNYRHEDALHKSFLLHCSIYFVAAYNFAEKPQLKPAFRVRSVLFAAGARTSIQWRWRGLTLPQCQNPPSRTARGRPFFGS